MRVLVAGGGTGGHVLPALAIGRELRSHYQAQVLFVGTARGIEARLVPAQGFELRLVRIGALKNVSFATRARTLLDLPAAILNSWKIIADFRPDVVIGVGGYASGPAMLAAALGGLPTLAFEPNLVPGFANRVIATMVSMAAVQFQGTCRYFRRCHVTGVPVRAEFLSVPARRAGPPTLLVFGGSQGARVLNQVVIQALPALERLVPEIRIIHQTGERDYQDAQAAYLETGISAEVSPFIHQMAEAFARADLLLCRAGASTVGEITTAGKAAILVPFPRAADDHQRRNAQALAQAGAAVLLPEAELTPQRLVAIVSGLLQEPARLAEMSAAARQLAHPQAAQEIAAMAARLAAGR